MRILYISPENTVGTLSLWKKEHEANGHECRTVTFFRSPKYFDEDTSQIESSKLSYNKELQDNLWKESETLINNY